MAVRLLTWKRSNTRMESMSCRRPSDSPLEVRSGSTSTTSVTPSRSAPRGSENRSLRSEAFEYEDGVYVLQATFRLASGSAIRLDFYDFSDAIEICTEGERESLPQIGSVRIRGWSLCPAGDLQTRLWKCDQARLLRLQ